MRSGRLVGALAVALAACWLIVGPAQISGAAVGKHFVSSSPIGNDTSCASPGFNAIQDAVNAASAGDTIVICSGTYDEQVTVGKSLILAGSGAASTAIHLPASPVDSTCNPGAGGNHSQDIVDVCGAGVAVTISALTVAGPWPIADCSVQPFGVAVVGGATANLSNDTITGIRQDPLNGCQGGIAVLAGRASTSQVGSATLSKDTVTDYQKVGVVVSNAGSVGSIKASTITGPGATDQIASNGVEVVDGAKGTITNGTISGNECDQATCGPDPILDFQAAGVLLIDPASGTKIKGTRVTANDIGIYNFEDASTAVPSINSTTLSGNRDEGLVFDQGNAKFVNGKITGGLVGVSVVSYTGQTGSPKGSVTGSTISGATDAAVSAVTDGSPGLPVPSVSVTTSDLSGDAYGVRNDSNGIVKATKDWWGDVNGPSDWSFGAGTGISANVDAFPWALTSGLTTFAACTLSGSTIISNPGAPYDILCGTTGNDYIEEDGTGPSLLLGKGGSDQLIGGTGIDDIIGSAGNDFVNGHDGGDSIQGRGGTDTCTPYAGDRTNGC